MPIDTPRPVTSTPTEAEASARTLVWGVDARWPDAIAIDEKNVYWAGDGGIRVVPREGGAYRALAERPKGIADFDDMLLVGDEIVLSASGGGRHILAMKKAGGPLRKLVSGTGMNAQIGADERFVYTCSSGATQGLARTPLDAPEEKDPRKLPKREVLVDVECRAVKHSRGELFFLTSEGVFVTSAREPRSPPTKLASGKPDKLAVDDQRIAWREWVDADKAYAVRAIPRNAKPPAAVETIADHSTTHLFTAREVVVAGPGRLEAVPLGGGARRIADVGWGLPLAIAADARSVVYATRSAIRSVPVGTDGRVIGVPAGGPPEQCERPLPDDPRDSTPMIAEGASAIAVDATSIYAIGTDKVFRAPKSATPKASLVVVKEKDLVPEIIALDESSVFYATKSGIRMLPKSLSGAPVEIAKITGVKALAVSATEVFAIVVEDPKAPASPGQLVRLKKSPGAEVTTVAKDINQSHALFVDKTHVFWGSFGGAFASMPLSGPPTTTGVGAAEISDAIAADDKFIYFGGGRDAYVARVPRGAAANAVTPDLGLTLMFYGTKQLVVDRGDVFVRGGEGEFGKAVLVPSFDGKCPRFVYAPLSGFVASIAVDDKMLFVAEDKGIYAVPRETSVVSKPSPTH